MELENIYSQLKNNYWLSNKLWTEISSLNEFKTKVKKIDNNKLKVEIKFPENNGYKSIHQEKIQNRTITFERLDENSDLYIPVEKDILKSFIAICARDLLVMRSPIYLEYNLTNELLNIEPCKIFAKLPTQTNRRKFWLSKTIWFDEGCFIKDGDEFDFSYRELHPIEDAALENNTIIKPLIKSIRQDSKEFYIFDTEISFYFVNEYPTYNNCYFDITKVLYMGNLTEEFINDSYSEWYEGAAYSKADCFMNIRELERIIQKASNNYLTNGDMKNKDILFNELKKEYEDEVQLDYNEDIKPENYDLLIQKINEENNNKIYLIYNTKKNIATLTDGLSNSTYKLKNIDNIIGRPHFGIGYQFTEDFLKQLNVN